MATKFKEIKINGHLKVVCKTCGCKCDPLAFYIQGNRTICKCDHPVFNTKS